MSKPSVTAEALLAKLYEDSVIDDLGVISILGPERHALTLNRVELALVRHSVLSSEKLADYKQTISGIRTYLPGDIEVTAHLPERVARTHGALLTAREEPLVLLVEDTQENLDAITNVAGGLPFDVALVTAPHFAALFKSAYGGKTYTSRPFARDLFDVLDATIAADATDLLLTVGLAPRVRVDGQITELDLRPVDRAWIREQIDRLASPRHLEDLARKFSTDLAYSYGPARFRVNIAHDVSGPTMALRLLPSKVPSPEDINLPEGIRKLAHLERGLILVTGPTGSGKSTTLASLLSEIINRSARHVITLEDPVEFKLPTDGQSQVNQRELGSSFESFPGGLRDALRQDPDVILVGEMRDPVTIATALTATETGHLVLGTLHTYDAASTIARVVSSFPAGEQDAVRAQLSQLLRAVVSQSLVPRSSGKGRVAGFEVLLNNTAVASALRKLDGYGSLKQIMQTASTAGMQTMEMSLAHLAHQGVVTIPEARFRARDLAEFERYLAYYKTQMPMG